MSAMGLNPVMRNLLFWFAMLAVCLAVSAC